MAASPRMKEGVEVGCKIDAVRSNAYIPRSPRQRRGPEGPAPDLNRATCAFRGQDRRVCGLHGTNSRSHDNELAPYTGVSSEW